MIIEDPDTVQTLVQFTGNDRRRYVPFHLDMTHQIYHREKKCLSRLVNFLPIVFFPPQSVLIPIGGGGK